RRSSLAGIRSGRLRRRVRPPALRSRVYFHRMALRFGTDGVRGIANVELTPELVLALGRAAGRVLAAPVPFLIGRATRPSGPSLEGALAAGLASEGVEVALLGVLPTPGVAWRSARDRAP